MKWFKKSARKLEVPPLPPRDRDFNAFAELCGAARKGDVGALEVYFEGSTTEYIATSLSASYALVSACEGGQAAAVRLMLDLGVPVNTTLGNGMTPERAAAEGGHHHILLVLREYAIKAGQEPSQLMEQAQSLAEAKKMLEMTKIVTGAPELQKDIAVRKPLKFNKPEQP